MTSINPLPTNDAHVASWTLHKLIGGDYSVMLQFAVSYGLKSPNKHNITTAIRVIVFLPVECQQYSNNERTGWQLSRHPPNDVHLLSRVGVEG